MSQNRSTAVMQRRRVAPDSLDYFPTPPFATRALCEFLAGELGDLSALTAWEPACGELHMARPLAEAFGHVRASDVHRYCEGHELLDFLLFGREEPQVDIVATNPPFRLAQAFIETGLKVARHGVAMLVRSAFLEGGARYQDLWSRSPPSHVLQFCERVVMLEGRLIQSGALDPFAERAGTKATSATAYVWLVWLHKHRGAGTQFRWIEPSRVRLERAGDYPKYEIAGASAAEALL
jgi:hypothetical protein